MKKARFLLYTLLLFALLTPVNGSAATTGIQPSDVAGEPTDYLKVVKEPVPQLMGGWQVTWERYREKTGQKDVNPVQYWLVKKDDKYALYFFRIKTEAGNKRYVGWKDWTVNGDTITSPTGVKFFAKGDDVFFQWQYDKPQKMSRIPQ